MRGIKRCRVSGSSPHNGSRNQPFRRSRGAGHGFSLIELLITTLILAVVTAAIGACLAGGIRSFDAARTYLEIECGTVTGLEIVEQDFGRLRRSATIRFKGMSDQVTFPVRFGPESGSKRIDGTVRYQYDRPGGVLLRVGWAVGGMEPGSGMGEPVVTGLQDCRFRYRGMSSGQMVVTDWQSDWLDATNLPLAVEIECRAGDAPDDAVGIRRVMVLRVHGPPTREVVKGAN